MQGTSKRESRKPEKKIEVNNLRNNIRKKKGSDSFLKILFFVGITFKSFFEDDFGGCKVD